MYKRNILKRSGWLSISSKNDENRTGVGQTPCWRSLCESPELPASRNHRIPLTTGSGNRHLSGRVTRKGNWLSDSQSPCALMKSFSEPTGTHWIIVLNENRTVSSRGLWSTQNKADSVLGKKKLSRFQRSLPEDTPSHWPAFGVAHGKPAIQGQEPAAPSKYAFVDTLGASPSVKGRRGLMWMLFNPQFEDQRAWDSTSLKIRINHSWDS